MEMTKYNKKKPSGMAKNGNGDDSAKARYQSMHAKCMNQGREAALHGDAVEAERFFQQAEHYLRIMNNAQEKKAKAASSQAEQMLQGEKMAPSSENKERNLEGGLEKGVEQMARSPKLDGAQADEEDNKARSEFHLKRAPRRMAENPEREPTTEVSGDGALVRSARPRKAASLSENKDKPSES